MNPCLISKDTGITVKSHGMDRTEYIDDLISTADDRCYSDFCRMLLVMWWNM